MGIPLLEGLFGNLTASTRRWANKAVPCLKKRSVAVDEFCITLARKALAGEILYCAACRIRYE